MSPSGTRQRPSANRRQWVTTRGNAGLILSDDVVFIMFIRFARAATGVRDENLEAGLWRGRKGQGGSEAASPV